MVLEQLGRCDRLQELIINVVQGYWDEVSDVSSIHSSDCEFDEEDNYVLLPHPAPVILAALPPTSSIEVLQTRYGDEQAEPAAIEELIEALGLPAMRRLRKLYFVQDAGRVEMKLGEELEEYCVERGIEVLMTEKTRVRLPLLSLRRFWFSLIPRARRTS